MYLNLLDWNYCR